MKSFFILSFLLITACLSQAGYGQKIHPYVGASLNFLGVSQPGWGITGGVKFKVFYAGVEYGTYGHEINTVSLAAGGSYHAIFEDYYGVHGGVVIDSIAYFGLVFLHSIKQDVYGDVSSWFNIGPDVRFQAAHHLMVALAYTIRRGLNAGINFLF